jgi:hypothetical protein
MTGKGLQYLEGRMTRLLFGGFFINRLVSLIRFGIILPVG